MRIERKRKECRRRRRDKYEYELKKEFRELRERARKG